MTNEGKIYDTAPPPFNIMKTQWANKPCDDSVELRKDLILLLLAPDTRIRSAPVWEELDDEITHYKNVVVDVNRGLLECMKQDPVSYVISDDTIEKHLNGSLDVYHSLGVPHTFRHKHSLISTLVKGLLRSDTILHQIDCKKYNDEVCQFALTVSIPNSGHVRS